MLEFRYKANKNDLEAVRVGIDLVWNSKLDYIFEEKSLIGGVNVLSFDVDFLYLWRFDGVNWCLKKIKHRLKFDMEESLGWKAGITREELYGLLPNESKNSFVISGSLLGAFLKAHEKKKDTYFTKESYLLTIVHEFAHIYFRAYLCKYRFSKAQNLSYLKTRELSDFDLPLPFYLEEVFAFCVEYEVAGKMFPSHRKRVDRFDRKYIEYCIKNERKRDNGYMSIFMREKNEHLLAMKLGRLILKKYPDEWVEKLLKMRMIV